jgi:hypothetical protein
MKLNETQRLFKKNTLAPQADTAMPLKPAGKLSIQKAFEVYHDSYVQKLTEALQKTFEAVHWVVGDDIFHKASKQFIDTEPSVSYNLDDYGANFPDFLKGNRLTRAVPFLPDLGRFEWTYKNLYHRANPEPLPTERIQEILRADDCRIKFIDAMEIFASPFRVSEMWLRRTEPSYMFEDIIWEYPEWVLMFKRDHEIHLQQINHTEASMMEELREGATISETLLKYSPRLSPDRVGQLFDLMIKAGIIEDVVTEEN